MGRNLVVHPHVHCLVTAGGLDNHGAFVEQRHKTLLPARVLMMVFRGKLRYFLMEALSADRLALPSGLTDARAKSLWNRLGRTDWNVRIQETYPHGVSIAGYLARYITGGPISDRRLFSVSPTSIVFRYRDYRNGTDKLMRLHPLEGEFCPLCNKVNIEKGRHRDGHPKTNRQASQTPGAGWTVARD